MRRLAATAVVNSARTFSRIASFSASRGSSRSGARPAAGRCAAARFRPCCSSCSALKSPDRSGGSSSGDCASAVARVGLGRSLRIRSLIVRLPGFKSSVSFVSAWSGSVFSSMPSAACRQRRRGACDGRFREGGSRSRRRQRAGVKTSETATVPHVVARRIPPVKRKGTSPDRRELGDLTAYNATPRRDARQMPMARIGAYAPFVCSMPHTADAVRCRTDGARSDAHLARYPGSGNRRPRRRRGQAFARTAGSASSR